MNPDDIEVLCVDFQRVMHLPDKLKKLIVTASPKRGELNANRHRYYWENGSGGIQGGTVYFDVEEPPYPG